MRIIIAALVILALWPAVAEGKRKPPPSQPPATGWSDSFNEGTLDTTKWVIDTGAAPGPGVFDSSYVSLAPGMLQMKLYINGTTMVGSEIRSKSTYGYGTYEWVMRASSTATTPTELGNSLSGSVSAGFNYINNSQTEIDCMEVTGDNPGYNNMTSWTWETTEETSSISVSPATDQVFHAYKMVWSASSIQFYLDGTLVHTNTKVLPTAPAYIYINHWVGNSNWGGSPVNGTRYMYVSSFTFTPQ